MISIRRTTQTLLIIAQIILFPLPCLTVNAQSPSTENRLFMDPSAIRTKEVPYQCGSEKCIGYMALPMNAINADPKTFPAVLVVHEWWGLNDYPKMRADQLAKSGYIAFAVDLFGDGRTATHPDEAKAFMEKATASFDGLLAKLQAGLNEALKTTQMDPERVGAIGYCLGGSTVLNAARAGTEKIPFKIVGSFHGSLTAPKDVHYGKIHPYMAVFTGGADPFVPEKQVEVYRKEVSQHNFKGEVMVLEGAKHAFSNPAATARGEEFGLPLEYNKKGDEASWARMQELLKKYLMPR